jgi:multidrug efflux system outer membrane protein
LLQAKSTVESAKVNLALYDRRVAQDKNALVLLMGVDKLDNLLSEQSFDKVVLDQNIPVGLPATILLNRPDVIAAEHQLKSMNANIGAARAAFFPKISLTAAYGFSSASLSTLFSGGAAGAWSFAPKLTAPIFDWGNNRAGLQYAKVKKEMAVNQYEKVIQSAFKEVADELVARKYLWNQLTAQINFVQTAKETYELASARYQNGVIRYIVVLDSQRTLFNAQLNLVEVEKLRLSNLINLYKVLGGGWERESLSVK